MQTIWNGVLALTMLSVGYLAGTTGLLAPGDVLAQNAAPQGPAKDTVEKITACFDSAKIAADALKREIRYNPVTRGTNLFAVSVGGLDAEDDLNKGRGVDPETFAALYADVGGDLINATVADHLDKDEQGRVTYKGKVVRLYPISRLRQLFKERLKFTGEEAP